jgi:hypothetical protein
MTVGDNKETCLKPIGELAQLIEALPMGNFLQLMINLSKLSQPKVEGIIIGHND